MPLLTFIYGGSNIWKDLEYTGRITARKLPIELHSSRAKGFISANAEMSIP